MPKNKATDLSNHLFAQLERLGEEEITPEALEHESLRSRAIVDVAKQIIAAQKNTLAAMKLLEKSGVDISRAGAGLMELGEGK